MNYLGRASKTAQGVLGLCTRHPCPFSLCGEGHLTLLRPGALPLPTLGQEYPGTRLQESMQTGWDREPVRSPSVPYFLPLLLLAPALASQLDAPWAGLELHSREGSVSGPARHTLTYGPRRGPWLEVSATLTLEMENLRPREGKGHPQGHPACQDP